MYMVPYPLVFLKKSVRGEGRSRGRLERRGRENKIIFGVNEIFPFSFFQLLAIIVNDTALRNSTLGFLFLKVVVSNSFKYCSHYTDFPFYYISPFIILLCSTIFYGKRSNRAIILI